MSDERGWTTFTSTARTYDRHVDRCERCREQIVTHQPKDAQRRRYVLCCECTAEIVRRRAAYGPSSAPTLH